MRAGKFRHKFDIEAPPGATASQDVSGAPTGDWTTHAADCRGLVEERNGTEKYFEGVPLSEISHTVTMWYVAGVKPEMRIVWDGRKLGIKSVLADPRKRQLTIACLEST